MPTKPEDYFKFSKLERKGILSLLCLIIISLVYNVWIKSFLYDPNFNHKAKWYLEQLEAMEKIKIPQQIESETIDSIQIEPFDPNSLDEEGWQDLGLNQKQAKVIMNYRAKGGTFKIKSDLSKMYSISDQKYQELRPFILLPDSMVFTSHIQENPQAFEKKDKTEIIVYVKINSADSLQFIKLKGIGPVLSSRILNYRERLGGFHSIFQISEVYGLQDSTFRKIKKYFILDTVKLRTININTADAKTLKRLPYLRWKHANAIEKYRRQHGKFSDLNELDNIILLDSNLIKKIKPYLKLE